MSLPASSTACAAASTLPRHLALVAALVVSALAGCTTAGKDFEPLAVAAPSSWSEHHGGDASLQAPIAASAALPADRWGVFGDDVLASLQARAVKDSPDMRVATLRVLQSRVQETMVSAQRGVQAGVGAGVGRQRQSEYGSASRLVNAIGGPNTQQLLDVLTSPFTLYDVGFDASWEPDLWGRVLRTEEAASAGSDAQRSALRQARLSVNAEVARVYFALRSAQRQRLLVANELAAVQELSELLAAQSRSGLSDDSALNRQRAQLAALRAAVPALLAQEAQAMNRLTLLCGAEPGALNAVLAPVPTARIGPPLIDLRLGLPSDLVRHRPDVAAAEARLRAATANIGIAMADLYPRIVLGARFGLEAVGSGKFGDWGSRQWSVGPSLSLPLFDHGRRQATITLRELQQQEAAVSFQQTVLAAWHEVDDAISAYVAETQRAAQLSARTRSSEDEAGLARARYANGLTNYLPVLVATTTAIDARRELVDSQARAQVALAAVYKTLGDDGAGQATR